MASKHGPVVTGSDGSDFAHREKVALHYQTSFLNKGRLRKCIFLHLILSLLMVSKLVPDVLDRLDIFILEIEELEVPTPLNWEYVWMVGALFSFLGLAAIRKNRALLLQIYFASVNVFATIPILFALMLYFSEFWQFCTEDDHEDLQVWQGYPVAALWYAFLLIAMQVHVFTLVFAYKLINAWKAKGVAAAYAYKKK